MNILYNKAVAAEINRLSDWLRDKDKEAFRLAESPTQRRTLIGCEAAASSLDYVIGCKRSALSSRSHAFGASESLAFPRTSRAVSADDIATLIATIELSMGTSDRVIRSLCEWLRLAFPGYRQVRVPRATSSVRGTAAKGRGGSEGRELVHVTDQ